MAPNNGIYPYPFTTQSCRDTTKNVGSSESLAVKPHLIILFANSTMCRSPERPAFQPFMRACEDILAVRIMVSASNGRAAYTDDFRNIPITKRWANIEIF